MGNDTTRQIVRFAVVILLQGFVLQRINLGGSGAQYFSILVYPVLIMLLPIRINRLALIFTGFATGIIIDLMYNSLGVHASACVFIAFLRPYILQVFEPRGGYAVNATPSASTFGMRWFLQYGAVMLFMHLLFYFSMEVFTFAYIGQILLKTLSSFLLSFVAIVLYVFLFNPK